MYFWTTIRKNRSKYFLTRGISEDDVTRILLHDVIVGKDPQTAETSLLKLPGLHKFIDRLKTDREKEDFRRHMRKYINIWLPDCPFEVSTTNRYTLLTHEAAATARRFIKKGETIKYLCGNLVAMTSEEEKDLDLTRRDFSIVMSSRKKTPSLFLGPARFANHDCNANARLVTRGSEGMQVVAINDINVDDEITVTYGEDYFGVDNCECLCMTCEREGRNGWAEPGTLKSGVSTGTTTPTVEEIDATSGPYSFRRKRKYGFYGDMTSGSMTPDTEDQPAAKRIKSTLSQSASINHLEVPRVCHSPSKFKKASLGSALRRELFLGDEVMPSTEVDFQEDQILQDSVVQSEELPLTPSTRDWSDQLRAASKRSVSQPRDDESEYNLYGGHDLALLAPTFTSTIIQNLNTTSEPVPSPDDSQEGGSHGAPSTPGKTELEPSQRSLVSSDVDSVFDNEARRNSSSATTPDIFSEKGSERRPLSLALDYLSDSTLSDLSDQEFLDDIQMTITRKPPSKPKRKKRRPNHTAPAPLPTISLPTIRVPGDYIRTPLLLGEAFSRWVDCKTCPAVWVQSNGYYTRKECPRCERHSKLYGYRWPKTERAKGDEEERVMDHRTVHRFLGPEEEKAVRKRGRGVGSGVGGGIGGEDVESMSMSGSGSVREGSERITERSDSVIEGNEYGRRMSGRRKKKEVYMET